MPPGRRVHASRQEGACLQAGGCTPPGRRVHASRQEGACLQVCMRTWVRERVHACLCLHAHIVGCAEKPVDLGGGRLFDPSQARAHTCAHAHANVECPLYESMFWCGPCVSNTGVSVSSSCCTSSQHVLGRWCNLQVQLYYPSMCLTRAGAGADAGLPHRKAQRAQHPAPH